MVLDEDLDDAAAILAGPTASPYKKMSHRARGRSRPRWPDDVVPRVGTPSSVFATAQASVERFPERQKANSLPSPTAASPRASPRCPTAKPARDRHMAVIDAGGLGGGLDIVALRLADILAVGAVIDDQGNARSFSAGMSAGVIWRSTKVFSSSCRCIVPSPSLRASAASSDSPWRSSFDRRSLRSRKAPQSERLPWPQPRATSNRGR